MFQICTFAAPVLALISFLALFLATGQGLMSFLASLELTSIGWIFSLIGLWGMVHVSKGYIIANENGLQWCVGRTKRKTSWDGVVNFFDYWERSSNTSTPRRRTNLETTNGTLVLSPGNWTNEAELRACIAQYAVQCAPEWQVIESLAFSLPLSCRYDTAVNRNILGWLDNLHKYGLAAVVGYFALQWFTMHTLPGWGWLLTPTGLFVIVKQALPLVLRPMYRATQPRLGDKVIADQEGLRFVNIQSETIIPWGDITDFYAVGIRYVVVAAEGKYDFLDTLTDAERLRAVIPRLAVNAGQTRWRQTGGRSETMHRRQIDLMNGQQSVQCLYHYRALGNCGQLWGLTLAILFVAGITVGSAHLAWQAGTPPNAQEIVIAA